MLGSSDECLKYRVRLSILNKNGNEVGSHYDHPYSVYNYMEEEDKVDGGLLITTKSLRKACKPAGDNIHHKFSIRIKFEEL